MKEESQPGGTRVNLKATKRKYNKKREARGKENRGGERGEAQGERGGREFQRDPVLGQSGMAIASGRGKRA